MIAIRKYTFTTHLVREFSACSAVEQLGQRKCSMTLSTMDGTLQPGRGSIQWLVDVGTPNEQYGACIGVWWDDAKELTDYDGVMSLPKEARKLLRKCGLLVSRDC